MLVKETISYHPHQVVQKMELWIKQYMDFQDSNTGTNVEHTKCTVKETRTWSVTTSFNRFNTKVMNSLIRQLDCLNGVNTKSLIDKCVHPKKLLADKK